MATAAVLGRDEELGSLQAFLDRPVEGTCRTRPRGRGGDREVDALGTPGWTPPGSADSRCCPLAPPRSSSASRTPGSETCWRARSTRSCPSFRRAAATRARAGPCSAGRRRRAGGRPNARGRGARRAARARRPQAAPDRDRRRAVAGRLLGRRTLLRAATSTRGGHSPAADTTARRRHSGHPGRAGRRRRPEPAPARRSAQCGRAAADRAPASGRGAGHGRRCCDSARHPAATRSSRSSSRVRGPARRPDAAALRPPSLETLVRARLDALPAATQETLLLVAAHALLAPAQLDGDALEPAFAEHVIEVDRGVVRFTHPLLASVAYQRARRVRGAARTHGSRRSSTIHFRAPAIEHSRRKAPTPRSPRSSTQATASRAPRGRSSWLPTSRSTRSRLTRRVISTTGIDGRSRRRAQIAAGDGPRRRPGERAPGGVAAGDPPRRGAGACVLRPSRHGRSPARGASGGGGHPRLQAEIHRRLAWQGR